jgi:hypothetical protein
MNAKYGKKTSNFVTLQSRLNDATKDTIFEAQLMAVVDEFRRRNPNWTKFSDLQLCKAVQVTLDKILIDTTMQRMVNMRHVMNILNNFRETMVMAIQVYEDEEKPGYYIAWDGQHTAIALYIILTKVFGERLASAMIPVVIYPVKHKLEIRRNFILLNGDAKNQLDFIDIYQQQVSGVLIDGANGEDYKEWVDTALKNKYLADAGLFATHAKFGDEDQPGAFTLLADTLMSSSLKTRKHPDVTRMFARYGTFLNQERPVAAKEARQLYEYFNLCYEQGIEVDDDYLLKMVAFTKDYFDADFTENGMFWDKVRMAYSRWYREANKHSEDRNEAGEVIVRGFATEWRCGGVFLIAQLNKSSSIKTPSYVPNNGFAIIKEDLW